MSLTSPPALTITVPGAIIFLPSGYFQFAESDIESIPSAIGAQTRFVSASATESTEPASGFANAACGAWPIDVAIPFVPV